MPKNYKKDSAGLAAILKSADVAGPIHLLADTTASNARRIHPDAEEIIVEDDITDRARSHVVVKDIRAKVWQVRDGFLTEAAGHAGLEVTRKK